MLHSILQVGDRACHSPPLHLSSPCQPTPQTRPSTSSCFSWTRCCLGWHVSMQHRSSCGCILLHTPETYSYRHRQANTCQATSSLARPRSHHCTLIVTPFIGTLLKTCHLSTPPCLLARSRGGTCMSGRAPMSHRSTRTCCNRRSGCIRGTTTSHELPMPMHYYSSSGFGTHQSRSART